MTKGNCQNMGPSCSCFSMSSPSPPGNIFYLMEYREIFLTLLRKFDETKQPQSFLKDLVESTHLFLRMLERFCKGRNNLVVQVNAHNLRWPRELNALQLKKTHAN